MSALLPAPPDVLIEVGSRRLPAIENTAEGHRLVDALLDAAESAERAA